MCYSHNYGLDVGPMPHASCGLSTTYVDETLIGLEASLRVLRFVQIGDVPVSATVVWLYSS